MESREFRAERQDLGVNAARQLVLQLGAQLRAHLVGPVPGNELVPATPCLLFGRGRSRHTGLGGRLLLAGPYPIFHLGAQLRRIARIEHFATDGFRRAAVVAHQRVPAGLIHFVHPSEELVELLDDRRAFALWI